MCVDAITATGKLGTFVASRFSDNFITWLAVTIGTKLNQYIDVKLYNDTSIIILMLKDMFFAERILGYGYTKVGHKY